MSSKIAKPIATVPKPEDWKDPIREKLNDDSFNDVIIQCSNGESVRCQSFMLRVASDVFGEMLQVGSEEKSSEGQVTIDAPKFPSSVMNRVKTYCHLGELSRIPKDKLKLVSTSASELQCMMGTVVAADYYNIFGLGSKCLDYIKYLLEQRTNLAFLVASKFGLDESGENRCVVASIIKHACKKISKLGPKHLKRSSIYFARDILDVGTLHKILDLMPCNASYPLLKFQFLDKWVGMARTSSEKEARETVARYFVKDTGMLIEIGSVCPRHLVAKDGAPRTSTFVDSEAIMDAIYASTLEQQCRALEEGAKENDDVRDWLSSNGVIEDE